MWGPLVAFAGAAAARREARGALAALAGGRRPHAERVLASQRRDQPRADRLVGRLPVAPDAVRWEGGDRARERLGFLTRLALRHDPAREADALGLARVHRPAREDQIERAAEADDRRQSHRAAVEQRDAPAAGGNAPQRVPPHPAAGGPPKPPPAPRAGAAP